MWFFMNSFYTTLVIKSVLERVIDKCFSSSDYYYKNNSPELGHTMTKGLLDIAITSRKFWNHVGRPCSQSRVESFLRICKLVYCFLGEDIFVAR